MSVWAGVETFARNSTATAAVLRSMPRLDSLFYPGGDGGVLDWPAITETAKELHAAHPGAGVWVSAQELTTAGMASFWRNVSRATKAGSLAGVVYVRPPAVLACVPTCTPVSTLPSRLPYKPCAQASPT